MEFLSQHIENLMLNGGTIDNHQIRQLCKAEGIELDQNITKVKEAVELGLMHAARTIVQSNTPLRSKYDKLIDIYNRQPYVGTKKTLKQMFLQQYSTPLPVAFLMSEFVKSKSHSALYFEPSAGNGFLTIALPQENTICNEIDKYRLANLRGEHYRKVTEQDSRQKFEYDRIFDGVITNPPFLKEVNTLIFNALDTMKNNGRCAILRDGNASFTDYLGTKLRSSFTGFFDRLFQEYNVVKIININSKKIYAKQGTSFFMQIILIDGRRPQKGSSDETIHRVFNPERDKTDLAGFEELWQYFLPYISENDTSSTEVFDERETMRMAFNHLIKELGEDKGREVFEWYCKTYNVGISDPMPSTVKWEIFGTEKKFREIDKLRKAKPKKQIKANKKTQTTSPKFKIGDYVFVTNDNDNKPHLIVNITQSLTTKRYWYSLLGVYNDGYPEDKLSFANAKILVDELRLCCVQNKLTRILTMKDIKDVLYSRCTNDPSFFSEMHENYLRLKQIITRGKNDELPLNIIKIYFGLSEKQYKEYCNFERELDWSKIKQNNGLGEIGLSGLTESQWANELAKHEDWRHKRLSKRYHHIKALYYQSWRKKWCHSVLDDV